MKNIKVYFCVFFIIITLNVTKADWIQASGISSSSVYCFTKIGNDIFCGSYNYGIYKSIDNGINWQQYALNGERVWSIFADGNYIYAGTWNNGLFRSTDAGLNWSQTSLKNKWIWSIAVNQNYIYAGTGAGTGDTLFLSTNYGESWTETFIDNKLVFSLLIKGDDIFAGTNDSGLYLSTNNGATWNQTGLNGRSVTALAKNENYIYAGVEEYPLSSGIYYTTNNGVNWELTSLSQQVYSLTVIDSNVFAGTMYGVYLSSNNGANWTEINQGFPPVVFINSLFIMNNYLVAGTDHKAWYRSLSELIGLRNIAQGIPGSFALSQNYPNPFNPITKIRFDIPKSSNVKLVIYDILGHEVTALVNKQLRPGSYEAEWDAGKYASGIYFYTLTTESYNQTKRMVLIK